MLVYCNIANIDYKQGSRVLYTCILYKPFGQLLEILPINFAFSKILIQILHILKHVYQIKIVGL